MLPSGWDPFQAFSHESPIARGRAVPHRGRKFVSIPADIFDTTLRDRISSTSPLAELLAAVSMAL